MGFSAALVLLVLIFAAPFIAAPGSYLGLDGAPGIIDHRWDASEFPYLLGDFLCHQQTDRSFILNGNQMPFCARDVGLLLGFAVGMALCTFLDTKLSDRKYGVAGILLACVTAVQWLMQDMAFDSSELRLVTGIVSGFGVALFLCWVFYRE